MQLAFNIHGPNAIKNRPYLVQWHKDVKPRWSLVMDDDGLAAEIQQASPTTGVIGRSTHDEQQSVLSVDNWLNLVAHNGGAGRWIYMRNEQGANTTETQWSYDRLVAGLKRGWKFVVYNCSTGTPEPSEWGNADKVIRLAAENPSQIVLGLHEYAGGLMWSGMDGIPYTPDYPASKGTGNQWLVGRFEFLLKYCDAQKIKYPRIVITEHGFDDVFKSFQHPDLKVSKPYLNVRGWRTLVDQWAIWYPGEDPGDVYAHQLLWADEKVYTNTPVEGQLIFNYGNLGGNQPLDPNNWYQTNVEDTSVAQRLREAAPPVSPPPVVNPPPIITPAPPIFTADELMKMAQCFTTIAAASSQMTTANTQLAAIYASAAVRLQGK